MSVAKTVENDDYDLTNCDREPIHILGGVQPIGFLIAASPDWIVTRVSENVEEWIEISPNDLLGEPLMRHISPEATHTIRNRLSLLQSSGVSERIFGLPLLEGGPRFDVSVHLSEGTLLIECEPSAEAEETSAATVAGAMIARLQQIEELPAFYRAAARSVRALTGFDRVMIYRFDHDGSGEVIAEAMNGGMEPFQGLRYPATDIPKQARAMYKRNWLRLIADANGEPVRIVPELSPEGRPLDLTMSTLRAVSPIHLEYLRNMGVQASMSISILRNGELWGLIACHHNTPFRPSFERRTAAELFGQMFSLLLDGRERQVEAHYEERAREIHNQLISSVAAEASVLDGLKQFVETISDLIPCDGIGIYVKGEATLQGATPTREEFVSLVRFLNRTTASQVFATDSIARAHPPGADHSERAAGLLAIPISRQPRDYIVLFRREVARSVTWAGNPDKPVEPGPNGIRLTPRKSFEAWREIVRERSMPWTDAELRVSESLRITLLEVILRLADEADRERAQAADRQELLIAELNHRVRNILGLIRGLITRTGRDQLSIESYAEVLGGRVQALARAHDQITTDNWSPAPLSNLLEMEAKGFLDEDAYSHFEASGPNVLLHPEAFSTLALVVHELMTNSVKYGALKEARGNVAVDWRFDNDGRLSITWSERGGPPVQAPQRRGFGTTVIERSIPHELKGEAVVDYKLAGLEARFTIPAKYVTSGKATPAVSESTITQAQLPPTVMLVEDNMIIALDAEDMLLSSGAEKVTMAASAAAALQSLDVNTPDFAVLDVNLGDETSFSVADELQRRGVPFIFATGYGEDLDKPKALASVPVVRKPYVSDVIVSAYSKLRRTD